MSVIVFKEDEKNINYDNVKTDIFSNFLTNY